MNFYHRFIGCFLILTAGFFGSSYSQTIPYWMQGKFRDDYRINYMLTDTLWFQLPNAKFHILKWNLEEEYIIAGNDSANPGEQGLFTRIDYMKFEGMAPYYWGFCLTEYKAASAEDASRKAPPDRKNPRKGCNGFPFSRMRRSW
ncbi:MAG: hypothetical protein ABW036_05960 [Flavitalea sp.]